MVSETVRFWVLKFGPAIARRLRQHRPRPSDRWHLDEMVVRIVGKRMYLWRAVDHEGEVLDMLVQRRRDRGRFKFGWDAEKRRGIMTSRYLHITRPGKEKETLERAARAIELQFDYYGPFGFGAVVARLDEPMFDLNRKVTAQMLREREIAIHGSKQYVIDTIMKMRKEGVYDDFCFLGWFRLGGFEPKEIEEQMQIFAEEVMPVIASECGGKVELPARGLNLVA